MPAASSCAAGSHTLLERGKGSKDGLEEGECASSLRVGEEVEEVVPCLCALLRLAKLRRWTWLCLERSRSAFFAPPKSVLKSSLTKRKASAELEGRLPFGAMGRTGLLMSVVAVRVVRGGGKSYS